MLLCQALIEMAKVLSKEHHSFEVLLSKMAATIMPFTHAQYCTIFIPSPQSSVTAQEVCQLVRSNMMFIRSFIPSCLLNFLLHCWCYFRFRSHEWYTWSVRSLDQPARFTEGTDTLHKSLSTVCINNKIISSYILVCYIVVPHRLSGNVTSAI